MYSDEQLLEIHKSITDHKQHLVVHHGEYDMPPIMVITWEGDTRRYQIDIVKILNGLHAAAVERGLTDQQKEGLFATPYVVSGILASITTDKGEAPPPPMATGGRRERPIPVPEDKPLASVWVALEQYTLPIADVDEAVKMSGNLQEDFETNPDSKVVEVVATYIVETDACGLAEWYRVTTPHVRVEGGGLHWHDTLIQRSSDEKANHNDSLLNAIIPYLNRESLA
jgi:hypothetical protein